MLRNILKELYDLMEEDNQNISLLVVTLIDQSAKFIYTNKRVGDRKRD